MYIIVLTYLVTRDDIMPYLAQHYAFLDYYYRQGMFVASGPKEEKNGGVIIARNITKQGLLEVIEQDPLIQHKLATAELIAFEPTKGMFSQ